MRRWSNFLPALLIATLAAIPAAHAAGYTFTRLDLSDAKEDTVAMAINNQGLVAGTWGSVTNKIGFGLTYFRGSYDMFFVPGASGTTWAYGLNDSGQIVGEYRTDVYHGFLKIGGQYTPLDVPNTQGSTSARGINRAGVIVGFYDYSDLPHEVHGFIYTPGQSPPFSPFYKAAASRTEAWGINDRGQVVGYYRDANYHGFVYNGQDFAPVEVPGATDTQAYKVNNYGQIVGIYLKDGVQHGFVLIGSRYVTLDYPGASLTWAAGINDRGQVVGGFLGDDGHYHGFIATPREGLAGVEMLLLD